MAFDPGTQTTPSPSRRSPLDRPLVRAGIAAVLLAILGGVTFAVRSSGREDAPAAATTDHTPQSDAGLGPLDGAAPVLGSPGPDFALRTAEGDVVRLGDYRGKVVWINFWATWCVPCKKELPDIQALYDELQDQGLVVLTVNYKEAVTDARDFFDERELSLPILMDSSGSVYDAYRLRGLPDSFFVDRDGVLRAQQFGSFTQETMRERLAAAGLP